jgi:uncharacterized protein with PhoU and TrkA domain
MAKKPIVSQPTKLTPEQRQRMKILSEKQNILAIMVEIAKLRLLFAKEEKAEELLYEEAWNDLQKSGNWIAKKLKQL